MRSRHTPVSPDSPQRGPISGCRPARAALAESCRSMQVPPPEWLTRHPRSAASRTNACKYPSWRLTTPRLPFREPRPVRRRAATVRFAVLQASPPMCVSHPLAARTTFDRRSCTTALRWRSWLTFRSAIGAAPPCCRGDHDPVAAKTGRLRHRASHADGGCPRFEVSDEPSCLEPDVLVAAVIHYALVKGALRHAVPNPGRRSDSLATGSRASASPRRDGCP